MNRSVAYVTTPVIVFSDANSFLNADSIKYIAAHYQDPQVGGVAGEKRIMTNEGLPDPDLADKLLTGEKRILINEGPVGEGEGWYWKYESLIKKLDSRLKTTVGAAGELFSIRTALYVPLPENTIIEDFVQSLLLCTKGYLVKYEARAYAQEQASLTVREEMERKKRIAAGAFQAMGKLKMLFNVFQYPVISFQFISHRVLRWTLCPPALVLLYISSVVLYASSDSRFYGVLVFLQSVFYAAAATGWFFAWRNRRIRVFYFPFYFVFMNFCVIAGLIRYLNNSQTVLWKSASRQGG